MTRKKIKKFSPTDFAHDLQLLLNNHWISNASPDVHLMMCDMLENAQFQIVSRSQQEKDDAA